MEHATLHNLRDVTVDVPLGVLVAVTGVAGSGKSSLIHGCLAQQHDQVTVLDQSAIRGSRRSNPATYTGLLDPIRKAFAKANGVKPALFSANSEGACPECKGNGVIYTDLAFMAGVVSVCEACEGKRFTAEVLEYQLRGANIADVLAMSVEEARGLLHREGGRVRCSRRWATSGSATSGSGSRSPRCRAASASGSSSRSRSIAPPTCSCSTSRRPACTWTTSTSSSRCSTRSSTRGRTMIVIEHDLDVVARADWVIDMGPGPGHDGGRWCSRGHRTICSTRRARAPASTSARMSATSSAGRRPTGRTRGRRGGS